MRKLWLAFAAILVFPFSILGWMGTQIHQEMPPIPGRLVKTAGGVVCADGEVGRGQNVWQTMGGKEAGAIWGQFPGGLLSSRRNAAHATFTGLHCIWRLYQTG
jgi:nitric oxide reductase large subunit